MAAAVSFRPVSIAARLALPTVSRARWPSSSLSTATTTATATATGITNTTNNGQKQLILYSKPGCCLCDGLKEKLHIAFSPGGPHSLASSVHLQVRDITQNPEWERMYQYEIPVLARVLPDGTEETLPRLSPRLGAELIQKKIAAALEL